MGNWENKNYYTNKVEQMKCMQIREKNCWRVKVNPHVASMSALRLQLFAIVHMHMYIADKKTTTVNSIYIYIYI